MTAGVDTNSSFENSGYHFNLGSCESIIDLLQRSVVVHREVDPPGPPFLRSPDLEPGSFGLDRRFSVSRIIRRMILIDNR
jgi:hypothetical protein